ncbi:MAG: hypothetical protein IJL89_08330 [Firmicutes bacterium]|nr:hypothetical protein [Bacillota bacterium]
MGQYSCNGEEYDLYDYLALGDSITKGYALPDPDNQCYAALFARQYGFNYKNYGELGLTAEELLTAIQADMYPVSEPKVITISAGVNDVLAPILKTLAITIDLDSRVGVSIITVNDRLKELFVSEPHERVRFRIENAIKAVNDNMRLERICDDLTQKTLPKIAREIKKRNPDVQIIMTNIYNPYHAKAVFRSADGSVQTLDMTELFSFYAKRVNKALEASEDFVIADLDRFLTGSEFVNTSVSSEDIESITLDPHPTVEGHILIKNAIDEIYNPN